MKNLKRILFLILFIITSGLVLSCQEEVVQPADKEIKSGTITSDDDWETPSV